MLIDHTKSFIVNDQPTSFTLLVCGMLNCSIECIYNMGAEDLLCLSAIHLIHNIALYLSHQDIFLLISSRNETIIELWQLFSTTTSHETTDNYFKLTNLFSPVVLTNLWESISSLTTRLLTNTIINIVTDTGASGSWVFEQYISVFQQASFFFQFFFYIKLLSITFVIDDIIFTIIA